jgi:predicted nucleic acid-binding protein
MRKLRIYLDNCCYGRPFDDLSQEGVKNEAAAKMYIQSLIKYKSVELFSSFMLSYEISENPSEKNREHIFDFVNEYASFHVSEKKKGEVLTVSEEIMKTGIKYKDAVHLACSIVAGCDYFITTDKRVLNYRTDRIKVVNPMDFVKAWRETE